MMEKGTDIYYYWNIVKRRKFHIMLPALIVFVFSVMVALILPPVYKSTATILIEAQEIPQDLIARGACPLEDPQPKFFPATIMSPLLIFSKKSSSIPFIQCIANSSGREVLRYFAGIISSVFTLSKNFQALPFIFTHFLPASPVAWPCSFTSTLSSSLILA